MCKYSPTPTCLKLVSEWKPKPKTLPYTLRKKKIKSAKYKCDLEKNKLTAKYPVSDEYATKVVPIIAAGSKGYVGAAQISGPRALVEKCKGALALEGDFMNRTFRVQALIPVDSIDPSHCTRVQGVGVSAKIDVAI